MAWETFVKAVRASDNAPPSVAFYKSGVSFTRKAAEMLGDCKFVEFLIDEESRKLGIRPLSSATINSYSVGITGTKGPQVKINSLGLVAHLKFAKLPWRGELTREGELLVVNLPATSKPAAG